MEKEFITYEQALALKELGFDEPCIAFYEPNNEKVMIVGVPQKYNNPTLLRLKDFCAPTYSQAFRWFRDRKMLGEINPIDDWDSWTYIIFLEDIMSPFFVASIGNEYKTHQEAQLECLRRLIEIVKGK
jgi:hypothetical protein